MKSKKYVSSLSWLLLSCLLVFCACSDVTSVESDAASSALPADIMERLAERSAPRLAEGAIAPAFVVDPTWPMHLPNNWRIGQVGGLAVDQHDNVWVFHRPRSLGEVAAGGLGVAGTNDEGVAVDGLGYSREFEDQTAGCCVPAPSVLKFDQEGNLLDAWGGPQDPGFLENRCRTQEVAIGPGVSMGYLWTTTTLSMSPVTAVISPGSSRGRPHTETIRIF